MLFFFFFNDTATTEIYTLSLHDALPILAVDRLKKWAYSSFSILLPNLSVKYRKKSSYDWQSPRKCLRGRVRTTVDRKSTRLNSSHANISYAVFCLKKKKNRKKTCMNIIH